MPKPFVRFVAGTVEKNFVQRALGGWVLLCLLACPMASVHAQEEVEGGTPRISAAEFDAFYRDHLAFELYRSEGNPKAQEEISRMTLQASPLNKPALQLLLAGYLAGEEAVMATMLSEYAASCGVDNVVNDHVTLERLSAALRSTEKEEDVLWASWHDLYSEDLNKFKGKLSEGVYFRMETRIRKFMQRSTNNLGQKIDELMRLMELKGERTMVAMLANYQNIREPEKLNRLQAAVNALQAADQHDAVNRKLKGYLDVKVTRPEVAEFLCRECVEQKLYSESIAFAQIWSRLEPNAPDARMYEAEAWMRKNRLEEARGALLTATQMKGHSHACYHMLASIYAEYGEEDQAAIWLERLLPFLDNNELIDLLSSAPFKPDAHVNANGG